jgi:hypothetical protein
MHRCLKKALLCGVSAASAFYGSAAPSSATVLDAQLTGVFSDPVYIGQGIDNSGTAPATTIISDGNILQWGTYPTPFANGTIYSALEFSGASVPVADQTTPIQLGTITYLNGTSETDSIIFGATLTFSLNGVTLGSDQVIITSTSNSYSGELDLSLSQAQHDADYVNICGSSSNICSTGIQAFEDTEGTAGVPFSTPVEAALYGTYSIDPGLLLTSATYVKGDGVVGERIAGTVPEPSTWTLMLLGFLGLGAASYAGIGKTLRRPRREALGAISG